ncbi:MAG: secretin and TonB N-terminal domain-containing protein [Candidatus Margulisiibacteriota bacterium]|nr:secretin and TonB N-terminal domain-containing protein [Candidatus Margulisiibacteriota bacterium]
MKCIIAVNIILLLITGALAIERIDFVDAAVLDVIETLASQAGLDLVVSGNNALIQNKRTSVHLKNVSAEKAIDHILKTNGLSYEKKEGIILVKVSPQEQSYKGEVETLKLRYLTAKKVTLLLNKIIPELKASPGGSASSLVIQGKRKLINEAEKIIDSIDKPLPQILIESKVVELSESDSMRLGALYGQEPGNYKFIASKSTKKISPASDLQITINGLITDGKANVVASPRIATLDDHEAVINIGSRIPYAVPVSSGSNTTQWTVEYIDAGVRLKITPQLGEDGYITTLIKPEVSSISEWRTTAAGEFPVITTRNAQATLRVKDGETIVVGGLMSESKRENLTRVPILGYIPLVGMLFQNKTFEKAKTEIVFLITPHII